MLHQIKHWFTQRVIYEAEGKSLAAVVEQAVKKGVSLRNADLCYADFRNANLRNANLFAAYLRDADLRNVDLSDAYLRDAYLRDANLRNANLRNVDFHGARLFRCDLSGSDLRGAELRGSYFFARSTKFAGAKLPDYVPRIENIHQKVYAAASKKGALDMGDWHTCRTTHCRAGWVVTLAGIKGRQLEKAMDTPMAACLIYFASDPTLERCPEFMCTNEDALADMKRLAEMEAK